jgi:adenylate cyclase
MDILPIPHMNLVSKYSIAVLPFVNMSSDKENEYFSDGITEEIINALSKIEGLHVTARTSSFAFKNQQLDAREIGQKLKVSLILEGSIRKSDNQVRITAQLIKAADGFHLWSDTWDRELKNIFILQDEISCMIAGKINAEIKPDLPANYVLENADAFDWYLKGTYLLRSWDFNESQNMVACFESAISLDSRLILAYIRLCDCYTWFGSVGLMKPEEAQIKVEYNIQKAIELDPDLPDIRYVLAGKNFWIEWDFASALKNCNKALAMKPSFAEALLYKGLVLAAMGRVEEALDNFFQAERLNPLAETVNFVIGLIYNYTNENEKALDFIERNITICPYWYAQFTTQVELLCKLKQFNKALTVIENLSNDPKSPLSIAQLKAYRYICMGKREEAFEQIGIMEKGPRNTPDSAYLGQLYLMMGDEDKALDYLEYGMQYHAAPFQFIKIDSLWDKLRTHPRYKEATKNLVPDTGKIVSEETFRKYKKSALTLQEVQVIQSKLDTMMANENPWLNPSLNLTDLAEGISVTSNILSQVLNEFMKKNFYDYINTFRLEYFLKLSKENRYKNYTLLALAYECGFNSKTTFNTFFRKTMKTTPSDYFRKEE